MLFRFQAAWPRLASWLAALAALVAAFSQVLEFSMFCATLWPLPAGGLVASNLGLPKPTILELEAVLLPPPTPLPPPQLALPAVDALEGPDTPESDVWALLPKPCMRACGACASSGELRRLPLAGVNMCCAQMCTVLVTMLLCLAQAAEGFRNDKLGGVVRMHWEISCRLCLFLWYLPVCFVAA